MTEVQVTCVGISKSDEVLVRCVCHAPIKTKSSYTVKILPSYLAESDLFILPRVFTCRDAR